MVNKDIKDIVKGALSSVLAWIIIGIFGLVPIIMAYFGFKWIDFLKQVWDFKVSIVYLIALSILSILFIIIYHLKYRSSKKKVLEFKALFEQEKKPESIPESNDQNSSWGVIDKFRYKDVIWQICLPYTENIIGFKSPIYGYRLDDVKIEPEPLCPECETPLESTFIASGFGNTGKWKCLNEKCKFEKKAPSYFSEFKNKALKVWKSQNASKFQ